MGSNYQDILDQYLAADPATNPNIFETPISKTQQVEEATDQKRREAYVLSGMTADGSGYKSASQRDRDYLTMTPNQFRVKYGDEAAMNLQADVSNMDAARRGDIQGRRDGITMLGDTVNSAGMGFVNSLGGIAALGLGLVNDDAGVWASRKLGDLNEFTQGLQSDQLNAARRSYGAQQELDARDNKANYEKNRKEYGDTVAGLWRVGADVVNSLGNSFDTPMLAQDTVASGVGSLFAGGPIAKGLKVIGSAAVKGAVLARPSLLLSEAAGKAVSVGSKAAMPTAIVLMEGGGAYQQTAEAAYEELRGREDLTEDQKIEMANNAALMAAAIQAPVGAATGLLVSRFESSPLRVPTVRGAASNVVRETVEEGVQSGSGQLAQNVALSQEINPEQDLLQDVGGQAGLGALGGFGSAGAVQTPGIALRASIETAKLPFRAAGAALSYAGDRVEARNQRVQDEILQGLHDEATVTAPDAQVEAGQIIEAADAPEEVKTTARDFVAQTMERLSNSATIQEVAKRVTSTTADIRERLTALTELSSMVREGKTTQDQETPEILQGSSIQSIKDVVANAVQSESVQKAVEQGKKLYEEYAPGINGAMKNALVKFNTLRAKVGSQGTSNSPSVEAEITNVQSELNEGTQLVLGMAEQVPEQVDPEVADRILYHSENGGINLTTEQKVTLRSASATARAVQQGSELASKYGLVNAEAVSRQVLTDKPNEGSSLSLYGHLEGVRTAYNAGDLDLATQRLTDLRSFAQSQSNKVAAFNQALIGGNTSSHRPVVYNAHIGEGKFRPTSTSKVNLSPTNINSVKIAQQVAVEAVTLANAVNNLSDAFPDLGVEHVTIPLLDASLDGEAATVAQEYRTGKRMVPVNTTDGAEVVREQGGQSSELDEAEASVPNPDQVISEQTDQAEAEPDVVETQQSEEISNPNDGGPWRYITDAEVEAYDLPRIDRPKTDREFLFENAQRVSIKNFSEGLEAKKQIPYLIDLQGKLWKITANDWDHTGFLQDAGEQTRNWDTFKGSIRITTYRDQVGIDVIKDGTINEKQIATLRAVISNAKRNGVAVALTTKLEKVLDEKTAPVEPNQEEGTSAPQEEAPETVQEKPVTTTDEQEAQTVEKMYPSLLGSEKNRLRRAFKIPKIKTTRTFGVDSPITIVRDGLKNETAFRQLIDGDLNRDYSEPVAKAYSEYLTNADLLMRLLNKRLKAFLNKEATKKAGLENAVTWINGQAINIVNEDGTYNQVLIENALLAGLQWYLKLNQFGGNMDDKDVRQYLRLPVDSVLPEGLVDELNVGLGTAELSRSLSREIGRFWGFEEDSSQPRNYAEGVKEGVAKEILSAMLEPIFDSYIFEDGKRKDIKVGFLTEIQVDISEVTTDKNIDHVNRYLMSNILRGKDLDAVIPGDSVIRQFPTAIEKAVLFEPKEETNYIGQVPPAPSKTQLRNQAVENTPEQIKANIKQQNIPHKLNLPFVDTLNEMGEDLVMRLFAVGELDDKSKPYNINHKKSLKGKRLTIQSAFRTMKAMQTEAQNWSVKNDIDVSEAPIYFAYNDTAVNRSQMLGKDNPQSNKLTRHATLPTWDTLDLTKSDLRDAFFMGLAQALGVKVHTQDIDASIKDLQKRLDKFPKTLEILNSDKALRFNEETIDVMKTEGVDSPTIFYALIEYNRYQNSEDRSAFRTSLYFEADGVTNGVANAMVLFSSGPFTGTQLRAIARGGYSVGENALSLAQIRKGFVEPDGTSPTADLYGLAATYTRELVMKLRDKYKNNLNITRQFNAVRNVMSEFFPGVEMDAGGNLIIDRGATKNPLTITVYGAGVAGIAGNISHEIISAIYERMSLAAQRRVVDPDISPAQAFMGGDAATAQERFDRFTEDMGALTGQVLVPSKEGLYIADVEISSKNEASLRRPRSFEEYTLLPVAVRAMQQNVLHSFVEPMVEGISLTVGEDVMESVNIIKTQVQAWSLIGKFAYQAAYNKVILNKRRDDSTRSKNELLSREEEDRVLMSVWNNLPYFSTGQQNFLFGMKQSNDTRTEFARGFNDELNTPAFGYTPDDAGVAGIPGLTIGSGDGQTMLNAILNPDIDKLSSGWVQIFDGMHSGVLDMITMGRIMNRAVFDAWQRNPMEGLSKAFTQFVSQVDLSALNEEQRKALTKSLFPPRFWRTAQPADVLKKALEDWAKRGEKAAQGIAERHAVMAQIQSSVDQMAGAAAPYQIKGLILSGSPEQKAAAMERLRHGDLEVEQVAEQREADLRPANQPSPAPTFKQATPSLLVGMLDKAINKITSDRLTRALVRDVVRSGRVDDYQIHIGTREELLTKAADLGIQIPANRAGFEGFMHPQSKSIFVVNGNPETILHELIHAATYETLQAYYDGQNVGADTKAAIERIEGLMAQFKALGSNLPNSKIGSAAMGDLERIVTAYSEEDFQRAMPTDVAKEMETLSGNAPSPELFEKFIKAVEVFERNKLKERFRAYGISDKVHFRVVQTLSQYAVALGGTAGITVDGAFLRQPPQSANKSKPMILLAADMVSDPEFVLDHEMIHAFRQLGLLTASEWQTLVNTLKDNPDLMASIKSRYAGLSKNSQLEEGVADLFATWRRDPKILEKAPKPKSIFKKIFKFLGDINTVVETGAEPTETAEEIFTKIMNGEFGKRGQVAPVIMKSNLGSASINNLTDYQNALDEMERQAAAGNRAGELNEFMAWALSNADLRSQLKETKIDKALRIARSVIQSLKQLLWGRKRSAVIKDDMFTNLRFNTNIIMRSQQTVAGTASNGVLFHDPNFGQSSRLTDLMERMKSKITDYANTDPVTREINRQKLNPALANASRVALAFQNAGFNMTKQEQMVFIRMVAIMGTDAQLDANSTLRMQELFTHVGKHLSLESFMRDPSQNDPADIDQATQKFNILMGKFASRKDAYDRSVVLPAFVALATVNEDFRKILSKMEMPKTKYAEWNSVDNILDNIGDTSVDNLSRWVSGEGVVTKDVQTALDGLMEQMLDTAQESELYIEKFTSPVGNGIDRVNQTVIEAMDWIGKKTAENAETIRTNNPNAKIRIKIAESLRTITGLLNEQNGHASAVAMMSAANRTKVWRPMYDLLKDLVGRTAENAQVYDLIKIARTWVNGIRQQYREQFPRIVNSKFSRELTDDEQTHLYRGLGETGFASLMRGNSIERVLELMSDQAARDVEVRNQISKIEGLSPQNAKRIESKARQLAKYMISKKNDQGNLLRNAEAIAHLLNENGVQGTVTSQAMVDAIDQLVSVLAFNELSEASKASLASLVQSEAKGLTFILSYLQGQDEIDRAKATGNARFNHFKGHMPSEAAQGVSLRVSHDSGAARLLEKSYTRLRAFSGSSKDPTAGKRGYYFAPVSGRAPFSQGIMQNVQQTVSGVDKTTGFSIGLTAGVISDPLVVAKITANRTKETGQALMPVFDENGNLFAYERSVDPAMLDRLQIKTNMAQAMGIRSGRQVEEALSNELNKTLIDRLRDMWDKDKFTRSNEYINLFKSKDPIHKDAVKIFSNETMEYIRARFPEGFYVRKDMIDDAIGYRSASIGDAWTGNSRWSPATQEQVKKVLMGMFGNKAYQRAVQAESLLQNIMQDIRVVIVIKSIVVPMANAASNIYQLIGRGVPATQIFRSIPKKTSEIEAWHKSRIRQIEAEAELMATTDILERRRLEAEIQTIKDSHKRLSIWPLLQAGEFSSISDAGSRDDILLSEGKLSEYLERAVNKLPKSVQTAGKYAIISKDTALFRALQKSVEYGDFVAKSILYDDLIKRQGKTKEEALGRVTEEFVNYDRLPGRDRAYLESIGLLWFYNFKIRSSKVAVSMIRNNPVHSLISMSLPLPISGIGTSLEDNLWAALYDGRASNSVGFGMAFRAPGLLPLNNLLW